MKIDQTCATCRYGDEDDLGPHCNECRQGWRNPCAQDNWAPIPTPTTTDQPMPTTDNSCKTCIHWDTREDADPCGGCLEVYYDHVRLGHPSPAQRPHWTPAAVTDPHLPAPATPSVFDRLPPDTQLALVKALVARVAHRLRDEGIGDGSYAPVWRAAYQAYEEQTGDRVLRGPGQYDRPASALDAIVASGKLSVFARIVTQVFAAAEDQL